MPPPGRDRSLAPGTRRILHLDIDAFLASVEQALNPALQGRPVVVGGMPNERNLVMSCSYEARSFGVQPGLLLSEAARRCPQAIFRRGDSQAAGRMREQVAAILRRCTPRVEIASIDDFFADLTGTTRLLGAASSAAESIRTSIARELALPVTIGIGTNKMMARLAGKLAKPGGIGEILPGCEERFLRLLPVEHLPGVGRSVGARLESYAIRTAGDLRCVSREVLFASFGRHGLALHERARGIDDEPVCARPPRSIRRESTFEPEEGRREVVVAMLAYVLERAAHRLRRCELQAGALEVRILYVDTRTSAQRRRAGFDGTGADAGRRRKLDPPTDATDVLFARARELLDELPRRRALVKRVGITLEELVPSCGWQRTLFSDPRRDRAPRSARAGFSLGSRADRQRLLDRALDQLRERHGFGLLLRGTSWPLIESYPRTRDGFRLRTPSLNQ